MSLENQVALVTGASRGIGRAIAERLIADGARVIGTATSDAGAQALDEALKALSPSSRGVALDVTDGEACTTLLAEEPKIDILINNAGIARDSLLMRMKDADWDAVVATNLTAVNRLSKLVVRPMMKKRQGRIVCLTSVVGFAGNAGQTAYAATKAGLVGYCRSLAREVASRGITVNLVAPGFIDTDMTRDLPESVRSELLGQIPLGRLGSVGDVAAAVAYLVSPEAAYVTGHTLHVNGGMYMG